MNRKKQMFRHYYILTVAVRLQRWYLMQREGVEALWSNAIMELLLITPAVMHPNHTRRITKVTVKNMGSNNNVRSRELTLQFQKIRPTLHKISYLRLIKPLVSKQYQLNLTLTPLLNSNPWPNSHCRKEETHLSTSGAKRRQSQWWSREMWTGGQFQTLPQEDTPTTILTKKKLTRVIQRCPQLLLQFRAKRPATKMC